MILNAVAFDCFKENNLLIPFGKVGEWLIQRPAKASAGFRCASSNLALSAIIICGISLEVKL